MQEFRCLPLIRNTKTETAPPIKAAVAMDDIGARYRTLRMSEVKTKIGSGKRTRSLRSGAVGFNVTFSGGQSVPLNCRRLKIYFELILSPDIRWTCTGGSSFSPNDIRPIFKSVRVRGFFPEANAILQELLQVLADRRYLADKFRLGIWSIGIPDPPRSVFTRIIDLIGGAPSLVLQLACIGYISAMVLAMNTKYMTHTINWVKQMAAWVRWKHHAP